MLRSVKLDEGEVNGFYDASMKETIGVINVIKDIDEEPQPGIKKQSHVDRRLIVDVGMQEDVIGYKS
ncbi:hypothetical protein CCR75_009098 [Bremia lactucae]|uniref:Uncharacterized protein n=1 Tax=Bremia lactucae TaxID=4779 RepID=A0A976FGL7_BRELC|nr:hypothetical protein CCR75_009098 [Bremia lactucae]